MQVCPFIVLIKMSFYVLIFEKPFKNLGAVGGICALANVLGEAIYKMHEQGFKKANIDNELLILQRRLIDPNAMVGYLV